MLLAYAGAGDIGSVYVTAIAAATLRSLVRTLPPAPPVTAGAPTLTDGAEQQVAERPQRLAIRTREPIRWLGRNRTRPYRPRRKWGVRRSTGRTLRIPL